MAKRKKQTLFRLKQRTTRISITFKHSICTNPYPQIQESETKNNTIWSNRPVYIYLYMNVVWWKLTRNEGRRRGEADKNEEGKDIEDCIRSRHCFSFFFGRDDRSKKIDLCSGSSLSWRGFLFLQDRNIDRYF